ncbi:MAG TPA: DUF481 domain-containing protein [Patescibacteria group bacterium]|nr:DUF481 domain-containing protein [Patescibacteria group bacterium]
MAKFLRWYLLFALLAAAGARAQVVQFTNGDRLTGKWVSVEGNTIDFQSDAVGKISIPAAKVKSLTLKQPLVAVLTSGKAVSAAHARLANGVWTVESKGARRTIAPKQLREIISAAAYRTLMAERSARPWHGWKGNTTFGYSLQQGDQQTHTLSIGLNAVRRQKDLAGINDRWRTTYTFNMLFASAKSDSVEVKSNTLSTALRQDYFLRPHNFLFVLGQLDHIQPQNLYLRQTYGGGYGRDLLTGKRLTLSLLGGATFANEKFTGAAAEQYAEALVAERVGFQFDHQIRFDHAFNFYPNLTDRGRYRFDTTSTLTFKLNSWLNANMGVIDFYVSRIPLGSTHNNNVTVTAGIGANF